MHEKKLDITSHQGSANQNHNEIITSDPLGCLEQNSQISRIGIIGALINC